MGQSDSIVQRKRFDGLENERPKRGESLEGREWRADDSRERPGADERREVRRLQAARGIQLRGECEQRRLFARAVRSANRDRLDRGAAEPSHGRRLWFTGSKPGRATETGNLADV